MSSQDSAQHYLLNKTWQPNLQPGWRYSRRKCTTGGMWLTAVLGSVRQTVLYEPCDSHRLVCVRALTCQVRRTRNDDSFTSDCACRSCNFNVLWILEEKNILEFIKNWNQTKAGIVRLKLTRMARTLTMKETVFNTIIELLHELYLSGEI